MPTIEQVRKWADDFEREYPADLPDRLNWFNAQLGVSQDRLLRLMGMRREQADSLADESVDWKWAVKEVGEESAWWAESMICGILALEHFDWKALRDKLRRAPAGAFMVNRPGGKTIPLGALPPEERENCLLTLVAQGGRTSVSALMAFLSQPAKVAVSV